MDQFGFNNGYGGIAGYGGWRPQPPIPPKRGILVVHGQEGINALAMAPNDEAIALDETADIILSPGLSARSTRCTSKTSFRSAKTTPPAAALLRLSCRSLPGMLASTVCTST